MAVQPVRSFRGRWRIVSSEVWDRHYLDLEKPAHITFERDGLGTLSFGVVRGWIDYRISERDGMPYVEFSWEGHSDTDPCCGRGWAAIPGKELVGRLFIHNSDDSAFVAVKERRGR